MTASVKLKVIEAHQDDVNKGIVRIDSSFVKAIGAFIGDIICIEGERKTLAIVDRAYPSDLGNPIIRMDGTIRKNAKTSIGESVDIYKVDIKEAEKIVLVPLQDVIMHSGVIANIKKGLYKKPVTEGDIVAISSNVQEKKVAFSSTNAFAIDLFNALERDFLGFNIGSMKFKVQTTKPTGFLYIGSNTILEISNKVLDDAEKQSVSYEDVGGLKSQLIKIRELVELPLKHPEIFARLGIDAPKGILLYGPPGTGKTLLARAIASETEANFFSINAPEIVNKYYGESEKQLRELFDKASKNSPAVIFIDEIDAIASKRDEIQGETEKRIVAQLLTLMDGLKKNKKIIVVAATNRQDALDGALRRPGRFDRELEIGVPKEDDRFEILKIHTRAMPVKGVYTKSVLKFVLMDRLDDIIKKINDSESGDGKKILAKLKEKRNEFSENRNQFTKLLTYINDLIIEDFDFEKHLNEIDVNENDDIYADFEFLIKNKILDKTFVKACEYHEKSVDKLLKEIAAITHGFVGADLEALVKEAAFNVLRRNFPKMDFSVEKNKEIPQSILSKLEIEKNDFIDALKVIRPSAMREFFVEVPNVKWNKIGGLEKVKEVLIESVEWPLKKAYAFKRLGITPPKGILLYGPPGTGKTLLAKAVATETSCNFIYVKGPEVFNKFLGESEKTIRKIFEKARQNSPTVLFFDEFDAIAQTRLGGDRGKNTDSVVNQILTEMDGIEDLINVKVIAATNRPNLIDPALLRPGRFDKLIFVDIPNEKTREDILSIYLTKTPVKNKEKIISDIAARTQGYVGADIEALVREAALIALRKNSNADEVLYEDFMEALEAVKPSVNPRLQEEYKNIEKEMKNPRKDIDNLTMSSYI